MRDALLALVSLEGNICSKELSPPHQVPGEEVAGLSQGTQISNLWFYVIQNCVAATKHTRQLTFKRGKKLLWLTLWKFQSIPVHALFPLDLRDGRPVVAGVAGGWWLVAAGSLLQGIWERERWEGRGSHSCL